MSSMDDINKPLRDAVAARLAETAAKEQRTVTPGVCMRADTTKLEQGLAAARAALKLPDDIPEAFLQSIANVELCLVSPVEAKALEPVMLGATMPEEQLAAAWDGIRQRATEARLKIHKPPADEAGEVVWAASVPRCRVIGITGRIASGKSLAASMVPDAVVMQMADPLYQMVAAMLGESESMLRDRTRKERVIPWLGKSPRQLLQTLGTEWGRAIVAEDVWIRIMRQRVNSLAAAGHETVVIADVRFDNEAQAIRDMGGEVWRIVRDRADMDEPMHVSEAGISADLIDEVIDNRGTIDDLRRAVLAVASA